MVQNHGMCSFHNSARANCSLFTFLRANIWFSKTPTIAQKISLMIVAPPPNIVPYNKLSERHINWSSIGNVLKSCLFCIINWCGFPSINVCACGPGYDLVKSTSKKNLDMPASIQKNVELPNTFSSIARLKQSNFEY